jgi:hypothetical protein
MIDFSSIKSTKKSSEVLVWSDVHTKDPEPCKKDAITIAFVDYLLGKMTNSNDPTRLRKF